MPERWRGRAAPVRQRCDTNDGGGGRKGDGQTVHGGDYGGLSGGWADDDVAASTTPKPTGGQRRLAGAGAGAGSSAH
eukprot:2872339-Prymnesium_polylepis.1